ncbi:GAF and ANTAR domain-containing protein [Rhodococcus aetherivorans]|uniref:GAF and ANTAR domain-containing protein n=1 Tax=Rhodococcus aetherivorans TaxID=191292 RepID=UPI00366D8893
MYRQDEFLAALAKFARRLLTPYEIDTTLDALVRKVTTVLEVTGSAVSLELEGQLQFAAASGDVAEALQRGELRAGVGPSAAALDQARTVAVPEVQACEQAWPRYVADARGVEVAAVAALPMRLVETKVGVLTLFADRPRPWPAEDLAAAQVFADMATGYLVNANTWRQQQQLTAHLQTALESRVIIEQAKGIIAESRRITPAAAFPLIRAHARTHRVPMRTVAQAIVEVGLRI